MMLAMYHQRWRSFAADGLGGFGPGAAGGTEGAPVSPKCAAVRFDDVPWMPLLVGRAADGRGEPWSLLGLEEGASAEEKRKAVRKAALRWHPDKFLQKYGNDLHGPDRERILDHVKRMAQRVNDFKSREER